MKKLISAVCALLVTTTACGTSWWKEVQSNPTAAVASLEQDVNVYMSTAEAIFNAAILLVPAADVAGIEQKFVAAVAAVNDAEKALNDAVTAAVQAQNSNPDFTVFTNALVDAVVQVEDVVDQIKTILGKDPAGYSSLSATNTRILKYRVVIAGSDAGTPAAASK